METDTKVVVRKLKKIDIKDVWRIRNLPDISIHSLQSQLIPWETHAKWITKIYFSKGKSVCFVIEINRKVIGYCRFDHVGEHFQISLALIPQYQKKGYGSMLLQKSFHLLHPTLPVIACVQKENVVSMHFFEENNFHLTKTDKTLYYYRYDPPWR